MLVTNLLLSLIIYFASLSEKFKSLQDERQGNEQHFFIKTIFANR